MPDCRLVVLLQRALLVHSESILTEWGMPSRVKVRTFASVRALGGQGKVVGRPPLCWCQEWVGSGAGFTTAALRRILPIAPWPSSASEDRRAAVHRIGSSCDGPRPTSTSCFSFHSLQQGRAGTRHLAPHLLHSASIQDSLPEREPGGRHLTQEHSSWRTGHHSDCSDGPNAGGPLLGEEAGWGVFPGGQLLDLPTCALYWCAMPSKTLPVLDQLPYLSAQPRTGTCTPQLIWSHGPARGPNSNRPR